METETVIDDEQRVAQIESAMREAGESTETKVQDDYFGFDAAQRCMLPDNISWIDHQIFNEGKRRKYLNAINRDLRIQKTTQDALISVRPGDERYALLKEAIVGWNLVARDGNPVPFNGGTLNEFLEKANPKIIDHIEKHVRLANPWLLAEMSIEDIEREIEQLNELLAKKKEEEEANLGSKNR
jgi:hypothetical protein